MDDSRKKSDIDAVAELPSTQEELPPRIAEILPELPPEARATVVKAVLHAGPIPPPETLNSYDPEVRSKIIEWADSQHRHRLDLEKTESNRADRGQYVTALVTVSSVIAASVVAVLTGGWIVSLIIMAIGVGGPTAAIVVSHGLAHRIAKAEAPQAKAPPAKKRRRR